MAGYISEFQYYGTSPEEFIEVALPAGTDPSGYRVYIYTNAGTVYKSFSLGSPTGTMAGQDVYVIDETTPGFPTGDATGNMYPDDALALVDGNGNVVQFVSYWGNTVTATEGPANGMTSTDVGTAGANQSLQSDDGGSTYYAQSSTNPGTIPACYAPGTLIATPAGPRPVEALRAGDRVCGVDGAVHKLRWVCAEEQALTALAADRRPVLIGAGALGRGLPERDLIVSAQHRIAVGMNSQLDHVFGAPAMVPAKALTVLPKIRFMAGRKKIIWHHFLCDAHRVVFAEGVATESLLLGPQILSWLGPERRRDLSALLGREITAAYEDSPVLPTLTVGDTKRRLKKNAARRAGGGGKKDVPRMAYPGRAAEGHQIAAR